MYIYGFHGKPPQILGGGVRLPTLGLVGEVCQQIVKYAIPINHLYPKCVKKDYVCQFLGPHNTGKPTFLVNYFHTHEFFYTLHMSFGLPGPLLT